MSVAEKDLQGRSGNAVLSINHEVALQEAARRTLVVLKEIVDKGLQPNGNPLEALVQVGEHLRQTNDLPSQPKAASEQDVPLWLSEYLKDSSDRTLFTRRDVMRATGRSEHLSDARTQTMFLEAYRRFEGEQWGGDKRISRKLSREGFMWLCMKLGMVDKIKSNRAKGKKDRPQLPTSHTTEEVIFVPPDKKVGISQAVEEDGFTALSTAFPLGTLITNSLNFAGKVIGVSIVDGVSRVEIEFPTYTSKIVVSKDGFKLSGSYRLVKPEEEVTLIRDKRTVKMILEEKQRELRRKNGIIQY